MSLAFKDLNPTSLAWKYRSLDLLFCTKNSRSENLFLHQRGVPAQTDLDFFNDDSTDARNEINRNVDEKMGLRFSKPDGRFWTRRHLHKSVNKLFFLDAFNDGRGAWKFTDISQWCRAGVNLVSLFSLCSAIKPSCFLRDSHFTLKIIFTGSFFLCMVKSWKDVYMYVFHKKWIIILAQKHE